LKDNNLALLSSTERTGFSRKTNQFSGNYNSVISVLNASRTDKIKIRTFYDTKRAYDDEEN